MYVVEVMHEGCIIQNSLLIFENVDYDFMCLFLEFYSLRARGLLAASNKI